MAKQAKILIFFSLILLALILYLILTSESIKKIDNPEPNVKSETGAAPAEDYQSKVKKIFTAYEVLARQGNFTAEDIVNLKSKLLALKGLPAKFKELHLKFISALDRMEDYLKQKDQQGKSASQQIFNQLKADYSWLND